MSGKVVDELERRFRGSGAWPRRRTRRPALCPLADHTWFVPGLYARRADWRLPVRMVAYRPSAFDKRPKRRNLACVQDLARLCTPVRHFLKSRIHAF